MVEGKVNVNRVVELRCKTTDYLGVGAIKKMADIAKDLRQRNIERVFVVSGTKSHKVSGAWDYIRAALVEHGIEHDIYDRVQANPTTDTIDEATRQARSFKAQAIIGVGGGSPIDAAKSTAILAEYPDRSAEELYMHQMAPTKALPLVAVNLTHGTGTETNRFAVASIVSKQFKPVIAFDCIYPLWSIDDPALTTHLPADQTRWVSADALNHVTEAATTVLAYPYTARLACEVTELVAAWLPAALQDPNDLTARYFLQYASAIAGIAFDNTMLHYTHALEHPLSAVRPSLAHGLGLSALLPSVIQTIYPFVPEVLAAMYAPIVPGLKGVPGEAERIAAGVEQWLSTMGIPQKLGDLGFREEEVPHLEQLVFETPVLPVLVSLAPLPEDSKRGAVRTIYEDAFRRRD